MKYYGVSTVSEILGDFVVYRNLAPMNPAIPGLVEVAKQIGLENDLVPRKTTKEYARVIATMLVKGRTLDAPKAEIKQVIFLGDTKMNDATAYMNVCQLGGWAGEAFIASENLKAQPTVEMIDREGHNVYFANRWQAIFDFEEYLQKRGIIVDEHTALLVDLDKTTIGARGRNAGLIDQARVDAAYETIRGLLNENFDADSFRTAYDLLNQPDYHPFTSDNQDYLVYICLMIAAGLYKLDDLTQAYSSGQMPDFFHFIEDVEAKSGQLPGDLREVHQGVYALVQQGEPTPFKLFRYNEFKATIAKMGVCQNDEPPEQMLKKEIVITQEVWALTRKWKQQGALLFGLSDKPDEASIPSRELAAQGYVAIHEAQTHVVGEK